MQDSLSGFYEAPLESFRLLVVCHLFNEVDPGISFGALSVLLIIDAGERAILRDVFEGAT